MAGGRDINVNVNTDADTRGLDKAADGLDDVAKSADGADKSLAKLAKGHQALDAEIGKVAYSIKAMKAEFAKSGDMGLLGDIDKQERSLKRMRSQFAGLVQAGTEAGAETGKTFTASLQGALKSPVIGPALTGTLVAGAAAAAPLVGATLAAGVLGATGLGAIGAGLAVQFKGSTVQAAVADLATYAKNQLVEATGSFVPSAVVGLNALKREMAPFWAETRAGFESLTPYVSNLLVKLGEGLAKLGPGLGKALQAAGPILGVLAKNIPTLLNGVSIFFDEISKGGRGAAMALDAVLKGVAAVIVFTGKLLGGFASQFEAMVVLSDKAVAAWAKIPVYGKLFKPVSEEIHGIATSFDAATLAAGGTTEGLDLFTSSVAGAGAAAGTLYANLGPAGQSLQDFQGTMLSAEQAAGQWRQGLLDMADAVKQHGSSLEQNTANGESNISMLQGMVDKARAAREASIAQGQSVAYADGQYQQNIQTLIEQATKLGFNAEQVEALIGKYKRIPDSVQTSIITPGMDEALRKAGGLQATLANIDGSVARASVITYYKSEIQGTRVGRNAGVTFEAKGGIVHAASGLISKPGIYQGRGNGTVVMAEGVTGHEGFVPQRGISRSRAGALLGEMAGWHGYGMYDQRDSRYAAPAPSGGSGSGQVIVRQPIQLVTPAGKVLVETIHEYALDTGRTPAALFPDTR